MANKNKPSSLSIISAVVFIVLLVVLAIYSGNKKPTTKNEQNNGKQTSYSLNFTDSIFSGPTDAKVTFTEYFDFECPACQMLASEVMPALEKEYAGKVKFVFKMFPLPQHDKAKPAASAAICAADQGKYGEYRDLLVKNYDTWTKDSSQFEQYAKDINLNLTKFNTCRTSKQVADFINKDFQNGVSKDIQATPTVYINNDKYEGVQAVSFYEEKINTLLNK